ncbi:MAG TPA: hypothetical protein VEU08_12275, partial [Vicinamibacterales bacterium]|nr:hypothetical protein [Vicinamibacterales bacterium]
MTKKLFRIYRSQVEVLALCTKRRGQMEATAFGKNALALLEQLVARVAGWDASKSDGRITGLQNTATRRAAVAALQQSMRELVRVSTAIALPPSAAQGFPPVRITTDQQLVSDAKAMVAQAKVLADAFTTNGPLPADALTTMDAQIATVESAIAAQGTSRVTHVAAGKAAIDDIREGQRTIRALEPIYLRAVAGDTNAIEAWKNARRIGPSRTADQQPDPAAPPATTPAPAQPA